MRSQGMTMGASVDVKSFGLDRRLVAGAGLGLLLALGVISQHNYLLFHALAELFSIAVAWSVFMLVWNARGFVANDALVFLGSGYLFIGLIDLLHTLAYKGMGVFPGHQGSNLATQLWIAARYMESITLAAFTLRVGKTLPAVRSLWAYTAVTLAVLAVIFIWPFFPDCYIEGQGLTPFKKGSEYVISLLMLAALAILYKRRSLIPPGAYPLLWGAIVLTIASELAFTFYVSVYGASNFVGHIAKILSCGMVYVALIRSGLTKPYQILFGEWKRTERNFKHLVEEAPLSIMVFDARGVITYVNPFHLQTLAAGRHDEAFFIGRKIHELPRIVQAGVGSQIARVLQGETVLLDNVHFSDDAGARSHYQAIKAVPFIQNGEVTGGFLLREDITAQQCFREELARSEEKFARAFYHSPILMTISRIEDGTYLEVNDTFINATGYAKEACVGFTSTEIGFISEASRRQLKEKMIKHRRVSGEELTLHRQDGRTMICQYWGEIIQVDNKARLLSIALDVTEQKRHEKERETTEKLLRARLRLSTLADSSTMQDLLQETLDTAERLTDSQIGFFQFSEGASPVANGRMWSSKTMASVDKVNPAKGRYPVVNDDPWADCAREGRPVVINDGSRLAPRQNRPDGHIAFGRVMFVPVLRDHKVVAMLGVGNKGADYTDDDIKAADQLVNMAWDIVIRKKAECDLRASKLSLQNLVGNLPGIAFRCANDPDWTMAYLSEGCTDLTGYEPEDLIGNRLRAFADLIHPEDRDRIWETIQAAVNASRPYEIEYRIQHRDGSVRWFWERGLLVTGANTEGSHIEGFISDISDRKQAERSVRDAHQRMENLLSESPAVVYTGTCGDASELTFISRNLKRVLGWEPEYFYGDPEAWRACVHPDDLAHVLAKRDGLATRGHLARDYRFKDAAGSYRWIHDEQHISFASGEQPEVIGAFWDTTDQHRAQEELVMQKRLLRTILDGIPDVIGLQRPDHTVIEYNRAGYEMLGKSPEDVIGKKCFELTGHSDHCNPCATALALRSGGDASLEKFDPVLKRWFHVNAIPIFDDGGRISMVVEQLRDITPQRLQEAELQRLASAIDQALEAIVITDASLTGQYVNPAFLSLTGFEKSEIVGRPLDILHGIEDCDTDPWGAVAGGRTWQGRIGCRKKDDTRLTLEGSISPVKEEATAGMNYVCVLRDITDDLAMERRLLQAQKMEALGTLAGGIAHDFNNILFPMLGYAEMLQEDLPPDSTMQEYVGDIVSSAHRARELVKQILAFSRQSRMQRQPLRVQQILKETLKLTRASLPSNIVVEARIDAACPPILADPTEVHQVVMNLITNAYHAMEADGGVLTVTLAHLTIDAAAAGQLSLVPGPYIRLIVSDSGLGIDAHIIDRIFEPYFTTKPEGKGTGLGLAVIHGIVTACNGHIALESQPGQGTTITIHLPCFQGQAEEKTTDAGVAIPGGRERILLVDDEVPIIKMVGKMLTRLGYHVTTRTASIEALEVFRTDPGRFDLVITDMTMPNMTGDRLTIAIKKLRPDIPVILFTGFSNQINSQQALEIGASGFVHKPVLKHEIAKAIRKALGDVESLADLPPQD